MKHSLASGSGYLEIDHSNSPGITADEASKIPGAIAVGPGEKFERDIQQCSHCQRGVVLEPKRVRARAVCTHCYHYLCDECAVALTVTGQCIPFKQVLDAAANIAEQYIKQPDHPDAVIDTSTIRAAVTSPKIVLTDTSALIK